MIARAESGQASTPMTEFDATEIAHGVGELYDPLADQKGLALKIEAAADVHARGNRELVTQALANLVDNAIKYARPGQSTGQVEQDNGTPADILVKAESDGAHIRLSVSDHGPGIAEGDRGRVVQRFVRLEQSRSEPGSGLGLSLAAAVAHLHGGELRLEDNRPGLKATLVLPRGGPNCRNRANSQRAQPPL
jgi:signal transduction histidine kinase